MFGKEDEYRMYPKYGDTFVNLTPHPICVVRKNDVEFPEFTIQTSGKVARCKTIEQNDGDVNGVPVVKRKFGEIENLPNPRQGFEYIYYIVSSLTKTQCKNRDDLIVPDTGKTAIRDKNGKILAVTRFYR